MSEGFTMQSDAAPDARWFAEMAGGSKLIFFRLRVSPDVVYEYMSDAIEPILGVTAAEAMTDAGAVHDRVDSHYREMLAGALATEPGSSTSIELKWIHRDGRPVHTRCWMRSRRRDHGSVILEGTVAEISELRAVETELRRSEERHRLLAENAYDVIWTMDMHGTVTYVSPAVQRMRGITPEEAKHQTLEEIHPPDSAASVGAYYQEVFEAIRNGKRPPIFRGEHEYYRRDGSIMAGELQVIPHIDDDGKVVELLGVTRDVSERKRFEAELTRLAVTDPMTEFWNRHHGEVLLEADLDRAHRSGEQLSLLMMDIDRFKAINDTFGHQSGDGVVVEVARRVRRAVRSTDVVARWGGDEFVILLHGCGIDDARNIAESIRALVADSPFAEAGPVSVSIGVAEAAADDTATTLVERADAALYEAKRSGRNTVRA